MEIATKKVLESGNQENSNNMSREPQRIFLCFESLSLLHFSKLPGYKTDVSIYSPLLLCATRATTTPTRATVTMPCCVRACVCVCVGVALMSFDAVPPSYSLQALMPHPRPRKVVALMCIQSCCAIDAVVYQDTGVAGS